MRQLISANDLENLFSSTRRDAQELLPQLIRRLIQATAGEKLGVINMPAGDEIRLPGWDGVVKFAETKQQIPKGLSVWEMGVSKDPKAKANADFNKRTENPGSVNPSETTFVFVTPIVWSNKKAWVDEKNVEGVWKDVRVIDGSDLASWLERYIALARWIARELGRPIDGIETLDGEWRKLCDRYTQKLTSDIIIAGREDDVISISDWLASDDKQFTVYGETEEEALSFIVAVIQKAKEESANAGLVDRLIFVEDKKSFEHLVASGTLHIVVVKDKSLLLDLHTSGQTHIRAIFASAYRRGARQQETEGGLHLSQILRKPLSKSLESTGMEEKQADRLVRDSKGSLQAVLWMISSPSNDSLEWTKPPIANELAPLLLAGHWTEGEHADHEVVAALAGRTYSEVKQTLATWRTPKGPLCVYGDDWDWQARPYAWAQLAPELSTDDIQRFKRISLEVLGRPDPAVELSPEDRWLASVRGKVHKFSPSFRQGLVEAIVMLSLNADVVHSAKGAVSSIVRELLCGESLKSKWLSLAPWLPDFAEAAPDVFLESLQEFIQDVEAVSALFSEGGMFGSSPHTYVLWAVERLAWSRDHFPASVDILATLAEVDPGGNLNNRPANSLRQLFLVWYRGTSAGIKERMAAIEQLFRTHEKVAWQCVVSLLSPSHDMADGVAKPQWRGWADGHDPSISMNEYWEYQRQLVDILIQHAGNNAHRWSELVAAYPEFAKAQAPMADTIVQAVLGASFAEMPKEEVCSFVEDVRALIIRHENYSDADWALSGDLLDTLKSFLASENLIPDRDKLKWLFTQWPEIQRDAELTHEEYQRVLAKMRSEAVVEVFNNEGAEGLLQWASEVKHPESLGIAIADSSVSGDVAERILEEGIFAKKSNHREEVVSHLAFGYVWKATREDGYEMVADSLRKHPTANHEAKAYVGCAMPANSTTWDLMNELGEDTAQHYWRFCSECLFELDEAEIVIPALINVGRIIHAVEVLGMLLFNNTRSGWKQDKQDRCAQLVRSVLEMSLEGMTADDARAFCSGLSMHHLDDCFRFLDSCGVAQSELATLEWKWLPFLERQERGLKSLQHELGNDPQLFVELLKCVYRSKSPDGQEVEEEITNEQTRRASQSHSLLQAWVRVPGLDADAKMLNKHEVENGMKPCVPAVVGAVDSEKLRSWVSKARELASECGRVDVCDCKIGRILAFGPEDEDGTWPCLSVRETIEEVSSSVLDRNFILETMNRRGVHTVGKSGKQEQAIADIFRERCELVRLQSPRVGTILRKLAEYYESDAEQVRRDGQLEDFR